MDYEVYYTKKDNGNILYTIRYENYEPINNNNKKIKINKNRQIYNKKYYINNLDRLKNYNHNYYVKNKDKLKKYYKQYIQCELCKRFITRQGIKIHKQSNYCKNISNILIYEKS